MESMKESVKILIADDDMEDIELMKEALEESKLLNRLFVVENGVELMNFLKNEGEYSDKNECPRPDIILLDLNMPKKDGREALKEIKDDESLRFIPVVILTTSEAEEDVLKSYNLGASGYITKPVTFDSLVRYIQTLGEYWFEIVKLPSKM